MELAATARLGLMAPTDPTDRAGRYAWWFILLIGRGASPGRSPAMSSTPVSAPGPGRALPWGTFVVNAGRLVRWSALLFALIVERAALPAELRAPLMIGFLGAYTTFSTLALESWRMIEDGAWLQGIGQPRRLGRDRGRGSHGRGGAREGDLMKLEGTGLLVRIYLGESRPMAWPAALPGDP